MVIPQGMKIGHDRAELQQSDSLVDRPHGPLDLTLAPQLTACLALVVYPDTAERHLSDLPEEELRILHVADQAEYGVMTDRGAQSGDLPCLWSADARLRR